LALFGWQPFWKGQAIALQKRLDDLHDAFTIGFLHENDPGALNQQLTSPSVGIALRDYLLAHSEPPKSLAENRAIELEVEAQHDKNPSHNQGLLRKFSVEYFTLQRCQQVAEARSHLAAAPAGYGERASRDEAEPDAEEKSKVRSDVTIAAILAVEASKRCLAMNFGGDLHQCVAHKDSLAPDQDPAAWARRALAEEETWEASCKKYYQPDYCDALLRDAVRSIWENPLFQ